MPCADPVDRYSATDTDGHTYAIPSERERVRERDVWGSELGLSLVYSIKSYELILDWTLNGH